MTEILSEEENSEVYQQFEEEFGKEAVEKLKDDEQKIQTHNRQTS